MSNEVEHRKYLKIGVKGANWVPLMVTAGEDTTRFTEQCSAFVGGLDTRSSAKVNSALYITSRLVDFPDNVDDFEHRYGHGVDSRTIRYNLADIWDHDGAARASKYSEKYRMGEVLQSYDKQELDDMATYLYLDTAGEDEITPGLQRKAEDLKVRSDEIEAELTELEEQLDT